MIELPLPKFVSVANLVVFATKSYVCVCRLLLSRGQKSMQGSWFRSDHRCWAKLNGCASTELRGWSWEIERPGCWLGRWRIHRWGWVLCNRGRFARRMHLQQPRRVEPIGTLCHTHSSWRRLEEPPSSLRLGPTCRIRRRSPACSTCTGNHGCGCSSRRSRKRACRFRSDRAPCTQLGIHDCFVSRSTSNSHAFVRKLYNSQFRLIVRI